MDPMDFQTYEDFTRAVVREQHRDVLLVLQALALAVTLLASTVDEISGNAYADVHRVKSSLNVIEHRLRQMLAAVAPVEG